MELITLTVLGTVFIELLTIYFRFRLNIQATRDTATTIGLLTLGIRVHHGYVGLVLLAATVAVGAPAADFWLMVTGGSLFCSDFIHHFFVLWPITGSHEFDLTYD